MIVQLREYLMDNIFGKLFAPSISFVFLFTKILIKLVARKVARLDFNLLDTITWLGVELSVFSIIIWINTNLSGKFKFDYQHTVWCYLCLIMMMVGSGIFYGVFLDRKENLKNRSVLRRCELGIWITLCWFVGFAIFVPTIIAISL